MNSSCFKLYQAYFISFSSSNVGKFFWSSFLKHCIVVHQKKEEVVVLCSRPAQNVKLGIFASKQCSDRNEVYKKKRDARAKSVLFYCLNRLLFCRSRCRRCRRCEPEVDDYFQKFLINLEHSIMKL